jgi:glycosyltransferase involved in cell wall biosynthesis
MHVLTLTTLATMAQARALGGSLERHQPGWSFELVLVAGEDVVAAAAQQERLSVRSASQELDFDLDVETLLARYDAHQLGTLLLPRLLQRRCLQGSGPVVHLPSTAWVMGDLEPIAAALCTRSVMLVPRTRADVPSDGLEPTAVQLEEVGRIEETIMAVDGTSGADAFLTWWARHVEQSLGSLDARGRAQRPEDRAWLARFLELAPARFSTALLEDPGCNLNMWNLHGHTLSGAPDGVLVDGLFPVRFVNLPGFDPRRPHRLSKTASRVRVSRSPVLRELCERYADELRQAGWRDAERGDELGRSLNDGLVYDDAVRAAYAWALALGEQLEDPFGEQGSRALVAWLESPAPRGGAHGINRYVFHRVARERPDVLRAYPDVDGADAAGYVAWCWAFGRHELAIPERFMPPRAGQAPTAAKQVAAPETAADVRAHPSRASSVDGLAVRLTGYLGHTLGLGTAARGYARALDAAGVPVRTVSVPLHHLALPVALAAEYGRHEFDDLIHEGRHGFELIAVNADELPDLVERLGESYFQGPRIGIWGWETNVIPSRWQRAFGLVDEIWVYSRFMAKNIGAAAPVPVIVLPPPVQPPDEHLAPLRLGVPEGFLFLFIFDYLSTIQRKNPVGLIEAFKLAFAHGEGPQLLIKTINAPLRPLAEEEVLWAAHGRSDIHVIDRSLTGAEMNRMMAACDCYVSLHRSEGFGLTMGEAMAIGRPVIATGYSGNVDFMDVDNSYLVDHTTVRVGPDCEIYPPEGEWAQPSVQHAARLMRRVLDEPEEASAKGDRAKADVVRLLSPRATGQRMRDRLERLAERPPSRAEHALRSR